MKLMQNVSNHLNAFLSSSNGHAWLEFRRDEMFYTEHDFQVDLEKKFFMYYRVYTLKHCEIISLHSYLNYFTKYLIWCYGYNFYRIE